MNIKSITKKIKIGQVMTGGSHEELNKHVKRLLATRKLKIVAVMGLTFIVGFSYLVTRPRQSEICKNKMQKLETGAITLPDDALPLKSFVAQDSEGNKYDINIEGSTTDETSIPLINPDSPNHDSPSPETLRAGDLSYEITVPDTLELVSEGGYIAVKIRTGAKTMMHIAEITTSKMRFICGNL